MNAIAVYHHPQECGSPYIALISQETGEVVETVNIPTGYYDSGMEKIDVYTPVYRFTERIEQGGQIPTVDNVTLSCRFYPNPKNYTFRVTKVDIIREDDDIIKTWVADIHVEACTHDIHWEYNPDKDTFKKEMIENGFDLYSWDITRRLRTPFLEFLKDVISHYKDYRIINLIQID